MFRRILGEPSNAASQLCAVLPPELTARLDLDKLELCPGSFVNPELRWRHADLLFTVPLEGRDAFVYVLEEHQSRADPIMAFRMLNYIARIWDRYVREHPNTRRLPPVLPIVVHQGHRPWASPTELFDLLDLDGKTEAIEEYMPRFRFLLVSETPPDRMDAFLNELGPKAKEAYMTTAEMRRLEGEARGRVEGRAEGRTEALVQFMTVKFGHLTPAVLEAVNTASIDQIELWTSRVVTAETLDDVLR